MSTPPTGEDPQRGPAPDESPTTPQHPRPGASAYGQHAAEPRYAPPDYGGPAPSSGHGQPSPAWAQPAFGPGAGGQQSPYGQQPPWQPGWPPQKPPRDRTRTALIAALVAVGLAIAAGIALLVYVLSATILDRAAVESAVAQQFEAREGVALDLDCRHRMIVRRGADYECKGTTADGEKVEIRITITNTSGAYTWAED
jgi:hypothetical protein